MTTATHDGQGKLRRNTGHGDEEACDFGSPERTTSTRVRRKANLAETERIGSRANRGDLHRVRRNREPSNNQCSGRGCSSPGWRAPASEVGAHAGGGTGRLGVTWRNQVQRKPPVTNGRHDCFRAIHRPELTKD